MEWGAERKEKQGFRLGERTKENKRSAAYQMRGKLNRYYLVRAGVCVCVLVFVTLPDDQFSVSVVVMKTNLVLWHPLPLLQLPTKRIHSARYPWVTKTTGQTCSLFSRTCATCTQDIRDGAFLSAWWVYAEAVECVLLLIFLIFWLTTKNQWLPKWTKQ